MGVAGAGMRLRAVCGCEGCRRACVGRGWSGGLAGESSRESGLEEEGL